MNKKTVNYIHAFTTVAIGVLSIFYPDYNYIPFITAHLSIVYIGLNKGIVN